MGDFWGPFQGGRYSEVFDITGSADNGRVWIVECSTGRSVRAFLRGSETLYTGSRFTMINFRVWRDHQGCVLVQEEASSVFVHAPYALDDLKNVREVCTGLGALGIGAKEAGFQVVCQNELQPLTAEVTTAISALPTIVGDIGCLKVVEQLWENHPGVATTAAGIACQPCSLLGDKRGGQDPRSSTLKDTLRAAWLLQSPLIVLECVAPAASDSYVRESLQSFVHTSGFSIKECLLELKDVWPSARHRWWCVLAAPELSGIQLKGWRPHGAWRTVSDVLEVPNVTSSERINLRLCPDEVQALGEHRPLSTFLLQADRHMPTALHSWGSLFRPCPCQCRLAPFSEARLRKGGVCAVILIDNQSEDDTDVLQYRYTSAPEVALMNGLDPTLPFGPNPRLALSLVGQLASPLQSGWVFSQIAEFLRGKGVHFSCPTSLIHVLHRQRLQLLRKAEASGFRPASLGTLSSGLPGLLYHTHQQILAKVCAKAKYAEVARQVEAFQQACVSNQVVEEETVASEARAEEDPVSPVTVASSPATPTVNGKGLGSLTLDPVLPPGTIAHCPALCTSSSSQGPSVVGEIPPEQSDLPPASLEFHSGLDPPLGPVLPPDTFAYCPARSAGSPSPGPYVAGGVPPEQSDSPPDDPESYRG